MLSVPEKELVKLCQGDARALKNRLDFACSCGKDTAANPMKDAAKIMELHRNLDEQVDWFESHSGEKLTGWLEGNFAENCPATGLKDMADLYGNLCTYDTMMKERWSASRYDMSIQADMLFAMDAHRTVKKLGNIVHPKLHGFRCSVADRTAELSYMLAQRGYPKG